MKIETSNPNFELRIRHRANQEERNTPPEHDRIGGHMISVPKYGIKTMAREYMRDLRAAEMEAWDLSGGDYLQSR